MFFRIFLLLPSLSKESFQLGETSLWVAPYSLEPWFFQSGILNQHLFCRSLITLSMSYYQFLHLQKALNKEFEQTSLATWAMPRSDCFYEALTCLLHSDELPEHYDKDLLYCPDEVLSYVLRSDIYLSLTIQFITNPMYPVSFVDDMD